MKTVYFGLGSSIGSKKEKEDILHNALTEIKKWGENIKISSFFYSEPWGGVATNQFVNAVCSLEIQENISADSILKKIHLLEKSFHRTRSIKWEDRTLDVDILLFGKDSIHSQNLTIPHIYILERDFVYIPLLEISEDFTTKDELKKYIQDITNTIL